VASLRWTVSQIGARQHYGIPRGFEMTSSLRTLYTDVWCRRGRQLLARGPLSARALAGRFHPGVPSEKVVSFDSDGLWDAIRDRGKRSVEQTYLEFMRVGRRFCQRVNAHLARQQMIPGRDAFFGFNTASLETIEQMRERDILTVVDQIDPGPVEEEMVQEEARKWPGWQEATGRIPEEYFRRIAQEWQRADLIVVNSEWSRSALHKRGVEDEKMIVIPVGCEPPETAPPPPEQKGRSARLMVLWVGTVNLRKGIQYLIEAAKLLAGENIQFVVAGPLAISADAVASAPPSVLFRGRVNRAETAALYREADVFVLPTISDGFAITQLEAMGHGLPVITTHNCGEVVSDGEDGLLVAAADAAPLAEAILRLHRDRDLLRKMARAAPRKAGQFGLAAQCELMERAIRDWVHGVKFQTECNQAD